jgi:hypothetical protein
VNKGIDARSSVLKIKEENLGEINKFLLAKDNPLTNGLLEIIEKHGGVDEINRKAKEAGRVDNLMNRLRKKKSPFVKDLEWLAEQRDRHAFVSIEEYRRRILGKKASSAKFDDSFAVTLEISAFNFFPWLIEEAKKSNT